MKIAAFIFLTGFIIFLMISIFYGYRNDIKTVFKEYRTVMKGAKEEKKKYSLQKGLNAKERTVIKRRAGKLIEDMALSPKQIPENSTWNDDVSGVVIRQENYTTDKAEIDGEKIQVEKETARRKASVEEDTEMLLGVSSSLHQDTSDNDTVILNEPDTQILIEDDTEILR